jgi:hypothetical protein
MDLRCGCVTHIESEDLVGCPVIQVGRLTALVAEMEVLLDKERGQATQADSLLDLAKQVLAGEGIVDFEVEAFEE